MEHVRVILKYVDYDRLVREGLVPSMMDLVTKVSVRYPMIIYKTQCFPAFGILSEYIIRKALYDTYGGELGHDPLLSDDLLERFSNRSKPWNSIAYDFHCVAFPKYGFDPLSTEEFSKLYGFLGGFVKDAIEKFSRFRNFEFNTEYTTDLVFGHPDITTSDSIIDVKTTVGFAKMAGQSFLQVLSYYALARSQDLPITTIGIYLPVERNLILARPTDWNWRPFLQHLQYLAREMLIEDCCFNDPDCYLQTLGSHVLLPELEMRINQDPQLPYQIYISNSRSSTVPRFTLERLQELKTIVSRARWVYIHGPLPINLCNVDNIGYQDGVRTTLAAGSAIGCKGVVVHTGTLNISGTQIDEATALDNMETFVRNCLDDATIECPLLLETSAAEGKEICTTVSEMAAFFNRFSKDERTKLKICIDTCHVFSAGYLPQDYIGRWVQYHGIDSIGLIHFNNSVGGLGCCRDRHAGIMAGEIPPPMLSRIGLWAQKHNIPCVIE